MEKIVDAENCLVSADIKPGLAPAFRAANSAEVRTDKYNILVFQVGDHKIWYFKMGKLRGV